MAYGSIGPWIWQCISRSFHRGIPADRPVHLLLCIADHFEPGFGNATPEHADQRVQNWITHYPRLFGDFRDSDGRPPRHTFFYPLEMYRAAEVEQLAKFCRSGFGEVEIHLHHDNDNADNLRKTLLDGCAKFHSQHGLLARDAAGQTRYAFVHGNWALDNSRPDGRMCGINNELDVLRQTGCYADFTLPSYPSPTQTRKINSIYYAIDDPLRPKSHDGGQDVGRAPQPPNSLMLFQGPLVLNFHSRKFGILPRIENGNLQANQAPADYRIDLWLRARVQIAARPDWFFVKLHTHGAPESNQTILLGQQMVRFHQALVARAARNPSFHFHYVTAREMYNLARAAEAGCPETIDIARDFELTWPER